MLVVPQIALPLAASARQPRVRRRAPGKRTSPQKNRVGVFGRRPPGPRRVCRPQVADLVSGCSAHRYETASARPFWLSRDPIGEKGGVNLYGMVGNDAIDSVDLLGQRALIQDFIPTVGFGYGEAAIVYLKLVGGAWDDQGVELFSNWLYGFGTFNRYDDAGWTNYMERHRYLRQATRDFIVGKAKLLSANTSSISIDEKVGISGLGACRTEKSALPSVRPIFSRLLA